MNNWEIWAYLPNGDKTPGWALIAQRLTEAEASWLDVTLLLPTRAMQRTGPPARTVAEM